MLSHLYTLFITKQKVLNTEAALSVLVSCILPIVKIIILSPIQKVIVGIFFMHFFLRCNHENLIAKMYVSVSIYACKCMYCVSNK